MTYIPISEQTANVLTKGLVTLVFEKLVESTHLSLHNIK